MCSEFLHLPILVERKMRCNYTSFVGFLFFVFFLIIGLRSSALMTKIKQIHSIYSLIQSAQGKFIDSLGLYIFHYD